MSGPIKNPGDYSDREGTNVRLSVELRKKLDEYLKAQGLTLADYMNALVEDDLKAKGAI